jgi:hypothetical protein
MLNTSSTFPSDLGISTRVGLTCGAGRPAKMVTSFAEAQTRYREERLAAERQVREARRLARASASHTPAWTRIRGVMTRWTPWHSSDPRRRSSAACTN